MFHPSQLFQGFTHHFGIHHPTPVVFNLFDWTGTEQSVSGLRSDDNEDCVISRCYFQTAKRFAPEVNAIATDIKVLLAVVMDILLSMASITF